MASRSTPASIRTYAPGGPLSPSGSATYPVTTMIRRPTGRSRRCSPSWRPPVATACTTWPCLRPSTRRLSADWAPRGCTAARRAGRVSSWKSPSAVTWPAPGRSTIISMPPLPRNRSSASITIWVRRPSRTCSFFASPTPFSSHCGTATMWTTCRSPWLRTRVSGTARDTMMGPGCCGTSSRTISCNWWP